MASSCRLDGQAARSRSYEFFLHHFTGSLRIEPSDELCVEEEGCGYVVTQRTQRKRKEREGALRQNSLRSLR